MGFDIYLSKEKASSIGIEAKIIGTMEVPDFYTDEDGWEVALPTKQIPLYGLFVNGTQVESTNLYVDSDTIGWRSGPTSLVCDLLSKKDYTISF